MSVDKVDALEAEVRYLRGLCGRAKELANLEASRQVADSVGAYKAGAEAFKEIRKLVLELDTASRGEYLVAGEA